MSLAKRAGMVSASLTLAITSKAKKMKEEGIDVVGFGAGEPDFNTPSFIIDAAKQALDKGMTKYTPNSGTPLIKKAICDKFLKDNGLNYKPSQIVVSNGAKHSLYNAMLALVDEGDEVIIPAPFWLTYPELVKLCGGVPVIVETKKENGLKITPEQLKAAISPKTKVFILNSPNNPTGAVYSKEEIIALAKVIEETDIYVISDEIYEKIVYGAEHYSIAAYSPKLYKQTIVVNGASKSFSMTGWRIGYLAADEEVAKAIDNMQSHCTSNANSIAQYATAAALQGGEDFLKEMVTTFDERRKYMVDTINSIKGIHADEPQGAFYVMVDISGLFGKKSNGKVLDSAAAVAEALLDDAKIAVVPCESFGAPEYIRLSYAVSLDDIKKGLQRLKEFVDSLE